MIAGQAIVTEEDKLDVIQRLDRRWLSLNDRICCTRCGRIFPAREIAVLGGSRAFGPVRLHCPNENCLATPAEWTKCGSRHGHSSAGDVSVTRNGRVCLVRRMKRIRDRGTGAVTRVKGPARTVAAALRRLDAEWTRFWSQLPTRFSRMRAQAIRAR